MYALIIFNKCQHRDQIFAVVSVLIIYIIHDIQQHLNTYTLCTEQEQDSVFTRRERINYTHAIARMLYSVFSAICD